MTHRIIILGAGYSGLAAAKRMARRLRGRDIALTVVNATERFVERVRLHQLAAGQNLSARPIREILSGTGGMLVVARVTSIDLSRRTVQLDTAPYELAYDILVNALGSGADSETVPGVGDHAYSVAEASQAARLASRLTDCPKGSTLAVVGGGLTGIETATELAEAHPDLRVQLVTAGRFGGWLSQSAQHHLHRSVAVRTIDLHDQLCVDRIRADGLVLEDGRELSSEVVVWAAGFRAPPVARDAGLAVDERGRMIVDTALRSVSHPDVYGIGDAAAAPGPGELTTRMSCQTGLPMGMFAADAVARRLTGHATKPVRIRYVWQNISLGRRDGITQFTRPDDSPIAAVLTGRSAARFKESVTRGAALAVRHPGPYTQRWE